MSNMYVDFHCHPSMKPYGQSFSTGTPGSNSNRVKNKNSVWHYDPPNLFERALQLFTGLVKFTQADCSSLAYGNVQIICPSLYPIERGFFNNKLGDGKLSDLANSFVTSVGRERVDFIQSVRNYFEDLEREYSFYKELSGQKVKIPGGTYQYQLVSSYREIEDYLSLHPDENNVLFMVMSIEGLHSLNTDIDLSTPDEQAFLNNVRAIKNWQHPPFFVTFAHHFYNHLCGHARSLTGIVGSVTNQEEGLGTGFTDLGKKVLKEVLSTANGKRIYVDIKHMSAVARKEYFNFLQTDLAGERLPVIISHGAANGLRSVDDPVVDGKDTAYKLLAEDINFYDNELVLVAKTGGIIGLQLDERRIASENTLKQVKHSIFMNKIRHYRAELLWNQVQHIAELLDRNDLFAWDCIAIGSDFDGVINPLNGYLTTETMPFLSDYLERYAFNYMNERGKNTLKSYNQLTPAEIVNRIFISNGAAFMKKWF
ncbi:MAG: membrane dipeptidase [Chitinophagaceae bacterium]